MYVLMINTTEDFFIDMYYIIKSILLKKASNRLIFLERTKKESFPLRRTEFLK